MTILSLQVVESALPALQNEMVGIGGGEGRFTIFGRTWPRELTPQVPSPRVQTGSQKLSHQSKEEPNLLTHNCCVAYGCSKHRASQYRARSLGTLGHNKNVFYPSEHKLCYVSFCFMCMAD
jgi:hypothetical protein